MAEIPASACLNFLGRSDVQTSDISSPMLNQLCEVCKGIKFDLKTIHADWENVESTDPVDHHQSLPLLELSARTCHLCTLFLSCIRLKINPGGLDDDWIVTYPEAHLPIVLAYRKPKKKWRAEIVVTYGDRVEVILKLADIRQSRCSNQPLTVGEGDCALEMLYSAVTNRHSDTVHLEDFDPEEFPDPSEYNTFFQYEPGWVCNVFGKQNGFYLVAWAESEDPNYLAWIPFKSLTRLPNPPHNGCCCGKGVWEQPLIAARETEYLNEDPLSDVIIRQIELWISNCQLNHPDCQADRPVELPDRVLDVGPSDGSQEPFLSIGCGRQGEFVSLSYRWGLNNGVTAKIANLEALTKSIPLQSLPGTMRDAVLVTRKLGFRFLWIDALCIIQDSREDWLQQSVKMAQIYGNAVLNIQADCARDNGDGFLKKRSLCELRSCEHPDLLGDGIPKVICPTHQFPKRGVEHGSLSSRGWILQERALSKRIVHWTTQEVLWECLSLQASERRPGYYQWTAALGYDDLLPGDRFENLVVGYGLTRTNYDGVRIAVNRNTANMLAPHAQPPENDEPSVDYRSWRDLVAEYSSRELTKPEDKLVAISSLAMTFHKQNEMQGSYLAGLWTEDLVSGLIWERSWSETESDASNLNPLSQLKDLANYRAPSFSWASVEAKIRFPDSEFLKAILPDLEPKLVDHSMVAAFDDAYSAVTGGYIRLHGYTLRYLDLGLKGREPIISNAYTRAAERENLPTMDQRGTWSSESSWVPNLLALLLRIRQHTRSENGDDEIGTREVVAKTPYTSFWLLLHPTGQDGAYFRAGLHVEKEDVEAFRGNLLEKTVTIV